MFNGTKSIITYKSTWLLIINELLDHRHYINTRTVAFNQTIDSKQDNTTPSWYIVLYSVYMIPMHYTLVWIESIYSISTRLYQTFAVQ